MRLLRRLPKAANYRSGHCAAYSVPPLIRHMKGKGSDVNRNEGAALETEGEAEPFGSSDSPYSKRLYMLTGSLAMAPLRDGLHQRQRV